MGIAIETALRWKHEFKQAIGSCYDEAIYWRWTHDELSSRLRTRVWDNTRCQKLPPWAKGELRGYDAARWEEINRKLIARYAFLDGCFINVKAIPNGRHADAMDTGIDVWASEPHKLWCAFRTDLVKQESGGVATYVDSGQPNKLAQIVCDTCKVRWWIRLCRLCQAPLCDDSRCCFHERSHDDPLCALCAGMMPSEGGFLALDYSIPDRKAVGRFLALHRNYIPLLDAASTHVWSCFRKIRGIELTVEGEELLISVHAALPLAQAISAMDAFDTWWAAWPREARKLIRTDFESF